MQVQAYLFFEGRCDQAIDYYRRALGAEVGMLSRFKDSPEPLDPAKQPPGWENKVMYAELRVGDSTLLLSDGCNGEIDFRGFSLSLTVNTAAEAEKVFAALSDGGEVKMPLGKTFFSPCFGMAKDRFGLSWMVYVPGDEAASAAKKTFAKESIAQESA